LFYCRPCNRNSFCNARYDLSYHDNHKGLELRKSNDPKDNTPNTNNQCLDYKIQYTPFSKTEPSFDVEGSGILLKNATIWKANGDPVMYAADILLLNGKISKIGLNLQKPQNSNVTVINVNGKWVTPGYL
jgi:hypothetical protein